jgi:hypothetical protein
LQLLLKKCLNQRAPHRMLQVLLCSNLFSRKQVIILNSLRELCNHCFKLRRR